MSPFVVVEEVTATRCMGVVMVVLVVAMEVAATSTTMVVAVRYPVRFVIRQARPFYTPLL
jgi:hypothetical protein